MIFSKEDLYNVPMGERKAVRTERINKLLGDKIEEWLLQNSSMVEAAFSEIAIYVNNEKKDISSLFFSASETLLKAFYRLAFDLDNKENIFENIDWDKHLSSLLGDYVKFSKALSAVSENGSLTKIDYQIIMRRLPYLRIDQLVQILLDKKKTIHKTFSVFRIKQAILLRENQAEKWLLDAIPKIKKWEDKYGFTTSQIQKVFFDQNGNSQNIKKYLKDCREATDNYNKQDLFSDNYIRKVFINRGVEGGEKYLNQIEKILLNVYQLAEKKTMEIFNEEKLLNSSVKSVIRRYLLGPGATRSLKVIESRAEALVDILQRLDLSTIDLDDPDGINSQLEPLFKKHDITKDMKKVVKALVVGHSRPGNVF